MKYFRSIGQSNAKMVALGSRSTCAAICRGGCVDCVLTDKSVAIILALFGERSE